jgi:ribonuclease M5
LDDIGIEHARPGDIIAALTGARCVAATDTGPFDPQMMRAYGLTGTAGAARRRDAVGGLLGIGYANGRQFLNRLNRYGITERQFHDAMVKTSTSCRFPLMG